MSDAPYALVLGDHTRCVGAPINVGDTALEAGLRRLIREVIHLEPKGAEWKKYPYYTLSRINGQPRARLDEWSNQAVRYSPRRAAIERAINDFLNNSSLTHNRLSELIEAPIRRRKGLGLIEALSPYLLRHHFRAQSVDLITNAQVVLFNGGGLVAEHLSHYLPAYLFEVYLATQLNKVVVAVNYTASTHSDETYELARTALSACDFHMSREPLTEQLLIEMGIEAKKIRTTVDAAFAVEHKQPQDIRDIIDRLHIPPGSVALLIRGDRHVDADALFKFITRFKQRHQRELVYVSTCRAHDRGVEKLLLSHGVRGLQGEYDFDVLIPLLGYFDLVISDRYHGVIFSILAETPVVPVESTTWKTRGLMQMLRYPLSPLQPLTRRTLDSYREPIDTALQNRDRFRETVQKARRQAVDRVWSDYRALAGQLRRMEERAQPPGVRPVRR